MASRSAVLVFLLSLSCVFSSCEGQGKVQVSGCVQQPLSYICSLCTMWSGGTIIAGGKGPVCQIAMVDRARPQNGRSHRRQELCLGCSHSSPCLLCCCLSQPAGPLVRRLRQSSYLSRGHTLDIYSRAVCVNKDYPNYRYSTYVVWISLQCV